MSYETLATSQSQAVSIANSAWNTLANRRYVFDDEGNPIGDLWRRYDHDGNRYYYFECYSNTANDYPDIKEPTFDFKADAEKLAEAIETIIDKHFPLPSNPEVKAIGETL